MKALTNSTAQKLKTKLQTDEKITKHQGQFVNRPLELFWCKITNFISGSRYNAKLVIPNTDETYEEYADCIVLGANLTDDNIYLCQIMGVDPTTEKQRFSVVHPMAATAIDGLMSQVAQQFSGVKYFEDGIVADEVWFDNYGYAKITKTTIDGNDALVIDVNGLQVQFIDDTVFTMRFADIPNIKVYDGVAHTGINASFLGCEFVSGLAVDNSGTGYSGTLAGMVFENGFLTTMPADLDFGTF